jgi:ABC-type spermidine/putrescine transport system permease subunit I
MPPRIGTLLLLILPGAGFIALFLGIALGMTAMQSVGLLSFVRPSGFSWEFWASLADKQFLDSFLFSLRVGNGSAFITLLLSYPLAL